MIPANELRIGNFVMTPTEKKDYVIEVENIYSDGINGSYSSTFEEEDIEATFEELEAIPLMPELLKKCGFETRDNPTCYVNEFILFPVPDGGFYTKINESVKTIKSLHQLQNLYFALTGTELEIKL